MNHGSYRRPSASGLLELCLEIIVVTGAKPKEEFDEPEMSRAVMKAPVALSILTTCVYCRSAG